MSSRHSANGRPSSTAAAASSKRRSNASSGARRGRQTPTTPTGATAPTAAETANTRTELKAKICKEKREMNGQSEYYQHLYGIPRHSYCQPGYRYQIPRAAVPHDDDTSDSNDDDDDSSDESTPPVTNWNDTKAAAVATGMGSSLRSKLDKYERDVIALGHMEPIAAASRNPFDDYSHRKRAGAQHHRRRGKRVTGETKKQAIEASLAQGPDRHDPFSVNTVGEYMVVDAQRQHPLRRVLRAMRTHHTSHCHQPSRGVVRSVKRHSQHSRRNDVRSAIAHGVLHGSEGMAVGRSRASAQSSNAGYRPYIRKSVGDGTMDGYSHALDLGY